MAFVFVTLGPLVDTMSLGQVVLEVAVVRRAISIDSEATLALAVIVLPRALVFGENTVDVALAVIDLESVPMAHLGVKRVSFLGFCGFARFIIKRMDCLIKE